MKYKRTILFEHLDKHKIMYDNHYIDDTDVAFDAIEEAMEAYAKYYHEQQVKSVDSDGVGGSYRMLKEGERIQVGDEFIDNNGKWRMSGRFDEIYTRNDYYPHRRLD